MLKLMKNKTMREKNAESQIEHLEDFSLWLLNGFP